MWSQAPFLVSIQDLGFLNFAQDGLLFGFRCAFLQDDRVSDFRALTIVFAHDTLWQRSRETKIAYADPALSVKKDVLGFDVSVDYLARVEVVEGAEQVIQDDLNVIERHSLLLLHDLCQVEFRIAHHQK